MALKRKAWLGRCNGSRDEWLQAYRSARIAHRKSEKPSPKLCGLPWKAGLIVCFERHPWNDPLTIPVKARLASQRLIEEILDDEGN